MKQEKQRLDYKAFWRSWPEEAAKSTLSCAKDAIAVPEM